MTERTPWPSGEKVPTDADMEWLRGQKGALHEEWDAISAAAARVAHRLASALADEDLAFERRFRAGAAARRT